MKIYIVKLESMVDGEIIFTAIPCATEEIAKRELQKEKDNILHNSIHYSMDGEVIEDVEIEIDEVEHFFISDPYDDYYEDYTIIEEDLVEK